MEQELPLRDIHLPEVIGWWPPAPGWWILALLAVVLLYILIRRFIRYQKRLSLQRRAGQELQQIERHYGQHNDERELIESLSALLRRVAMSVESRAQVAGLTGDKWLQQLDQLAGKNFFENELGRQFIQALYQPDIDLDTNELLKTSKQWIVKVSKRGRYAGV